MMDSSTYCQFQSQGLSRSLSFASKSSAGRVVCSGRGWHGDSEGHASAGRKGGTKVSQNRSHMAEIGRRGGAKVSQDRSHMSEIGQRGGKKVSQDRDHMAEIGRKGGQAH